LVEAIGTKNPVNPSGENTLLKGKTTPKRIKDKNPVYQINPKDNSENSTKKGMMSVGELPENFSIFKSARRRKTKRELERRGS